MTNIPFTSNKPYLFRALYEWLLDNDATPFLLVDASQKDVQVPWSLVKDDQIVLNTSPAAIRDWFVDNSAISFSARFSGKAHNIYIPMRSLRAVYAQENGLGMSFPEETDNITDGELEQSSVSNETTETDPVQKNKATPHLKVIK